MSNDSQKKDISKIASAITGRPESGGPKPVTVNFVVEQVTATSPLTCIPLSGGTPAEVLGQPSGASVGDQVLIAELGSGLRIAIVVL